MAWLGHVPAHWEVKRGRFLFKVNGGFGTKARKLECTEVQFLPMEKIGERNDLNLDALRVVDDEAGSYVECLEGDVLVGKVTPCFENGKGAVARGLAGGAALATSEVHTLRPYEAHVDFLYYSTLNGLYRQAGAAEMYGVGGLRRVPPLFFKDARLAVPSAGEQGEIVAHLNDSISKIDSAISSQERIIELLKERIDSLVLRAISRPQVRSCRIEHIAELISRPIESNPAESYVKLGLYNRGRGLFKKDESNQDEMGESDFFYVRPGDLVISGQFAWEGAVAMAGQGEDGCVVSHRYPILRGLNGVAETEYLLAFLCTDYGDFLLNEHSRGAAGRNRPLNIKSLLKEKIPLPALEVQREIVEAIKQRQAILVEINKLNLLLKERRSAIITQAVTGQIDVR